MSRTGWGGYGLAMELKKAIRQHFATCDGLCWRTWRVLRARRPLMDQFAAQAAFEMAKSEVW